MTTTRPGGLGRGLGALLPAAGPGESGLVTLQLTAIVPNSRQPRANFDTAGLEELALSMKEVGLLQPILVRPLQAGRYEIVAGERRYRAAHLAGLKEIPAIVRRTEDGALLTEALVENIHRADLNPLEEAAAYQQLLDDFGFTHEALAGRLGKSRSNITNTLRLLSLPPLLQQRVQSGALSAGHARALLAVEDVDQQERAAQRIVAEGLSVRATEELVRRLVDQVDPETQARDLATAATSKRRSPFADLQAQLSDALATKVQIRGTSRRGRVIVDYSGADDLDRLLGIIGRGTGVPLNP